MSWRCCKDRDARNKINCQIIFGILRDQKNTSLLSQAVKMAPSAAGNELLCCCGSGCGQRWERWAAAMLSAMSNAVDAAQHSSDGSRARRGHGHVDARDTHCSPGLGGQPCSNGVSTARGCSAHGQPRVGCLSWALLSGQSHYPHQHITVPLKDI